MGGKQAEVVEQCAGRSRKGRDRTRDGGRGLKRQLQGKQVGMWAEDWDRWEGPGRRGTGVGRRRRRDTPQENH